MTRRPNVKRLHELFRLDKATGKIYWRVKASRKNNIGDEAGSRHAHGYRQVGINYNQILVHAIVFAMVHGRWPRAGKEIDHRNLIKDDNRPCNLRECSSAQNKRNTPVRKKNILQKKGVSKTPYGRFHARISIDGRSTHIGAFATARQANAAFTAAAIAQHGAFGRGQ